MSLGVLSDDFFSNPIKVDQVMNDVSTTDSSQIKPFTWSYSALKNFESCPLRAHTPAPPMEKTPEQERGDALHLAMKQRVMQNSPLPGHFSYMEDWAVKLTKVIDPMQVISCELKLSLDRNYKSCSYFGKGVWVRGLIDYLRIIPYKNQHTIAHIVDYKTGKPKEDESQLALNAMMVFACYSNVVGIRTDFLWTEYNDTTHAHYVRSDMKTVWASLLPRVAKLEAAYKTNNYPAKKCGLCHSYCHVYQCQFNGKR